MDAPSFGMALTSWAKRPGPREAQPCLGLNQAAGGLIVSEPQSVKERQSQTPGKSSRGRFYCRREEVQGNLSSALPNKGRRPLKAGAKKVWGTVHVTRPPGLLTSTYPGEKRTSRTFQRYECVCSQVLEGPFWAGKSSRLKGHRRVYSCKL